MEVDGETIIACSDATKVLEPVEHPLDGISAFVEIGGEAIFPDPCDLRRNVGCRPLCLDFLTHGVGVVSLVPVDKLNRADFIEQRIRGDAIRNLAAGQKESDRTAIGIGQGVDFGGTTAA